MGTWDMASFAEYAEYDGMGLAELVRKRAVHPRELVEAAIERIEAGNPKLNAIVRPLFDAGRAQAETPLSGPFAGVPFLVKDIGLSLAGVPTSQGTRLLKDIPSPHDDELLLRYRATGLIVLGKTNTPEFGLLPSPNQKPGAPLTIRTTSRERPADRAAGQPRQSLRG
jgi:amidase